MTFRSVRGNFNLLVCIVVCLIASAVIAIGLTIFGLRADAIEDAANDTGNIAAILAEQTARSAQTIDLVLLEIQQHFAELKIKTPDDFERLTRTETIYHFLSERLVRLPQADVITLADAHGQLVNSTRSWPPLNANFFDREHFQYLRTNNDNQTYISSPVTSRLTGEWIMYFNKRINDMAGDFVGVIAIGIEIKYFRHIYETITSLRDRSFLFLRKDGTVLIRHPDFDNRTGRKMPTTSPWYKLVAQGGGYYRSPGYFDGEARLVAVRPLRDYPFVVNVAISECVTLANWRRRATYIGVGTLLAVLCSILLIKALVSQFHRLLASQASLAEREQNLAEKSREIVNANERLDVAVNNMSQGLCMFNKDGQLVICNDRYMAMYGLPSEIAKPGCTVRELLTHRNAKATFTGDVDGYLDDLFIQLAQNEKFSSTSHLQDGRVIAVVNVPIADGGWVATHEDITERQHADARFAHLARHDALTDLANRVLFREKMDEAIGRLRRRKEKFCVFVFDLDMFKAVNDSLGHPVGDELLKAIAQRLRAAVRETDTVARVGGDEFAVLQTVEASQNEEAIVLANRLLKTICEPYDVEDHQIVIGISIGIALAPEHGVDADQLLKYADLALYRAKSGGRNGYRFFAAEMDTEARLRRTLETDLRSAISESRNEFILHYQNIITVGSGETCGVEALVRWQHPQKGLLLPDKFIPLAEEIGLIMPLGDWIMRKAFCDAATWPQHIKLAVNLSPAQFQNNNLVESIVSALDTCGFSSKRLELEITESVLLQKSADNLSVLHQLKRLGISIVLDDFGTGYSSLSYLRMFPFDKIKIDRSFVNEMSSRAECAAIVSAMTFLGRSLNIDTTAEGVETQEQLVLLRAAGCTQAQGYFFSRPRPVSELQFGRPLHRDEGKAA
jgi:diguanylate cyclase (GGDEF)-like protein